jgi:hypothetical protein
MIFIFILTLIVAKALPSLNLKLSPVYFTRISAIIFIYAGIFSLNILYIQSIGSGIGIYSGLFHITLVQPGYPVLYAIGSNIFLSLIVFTIIFILLIINLIKIFYIYKPGSQTLNLFKKNKKLFWSLLFLMILLFILSDNLTAMLGFDMSFYSKDIKAFIRALANSRLSYLTQYIPDRASNFVPTSPNNNLEILNNLIDTMINNFNNIFQPSPVTGYLDDLIGQQIAIYFIIFFISVNLILLMIVYIVNILLLFNKEFILKHFSSNRFFQFYFKYQFLSIKISLFILPFFIFLGLFTLVHSSYYMLTHPVPYDILGVDLHIFVINK